MGIRGGEAENLEKRGCNKEMEEQSKTASFERPNPKECATQFKSLSHPPLGKDRPGKVRFLAGALIFVESLISGSDYVFGAVPGHVLSPTGRTLDGNFLVTPLHFERPKTVQDKMQLLEITFRKNQEEFVASHPHSEIAFANDTVEASSKFLQHQITGRVAVGVVDLLEIVQIQEHHRQGMPFARGAGHLCGKPLLGKSTVV
jgi:hypothetical protein